MAGVRVPADVELADRLAFGLTAKQLAILAATAVSAYGAFLVLAPLLPAPVAVAAMGLVAAAGVLLALVRHDGLAGDQLALAIARFALAPKWQLLAPAGLPARLPGTPRQPRTAPLDIPVRRILADGLVELADGGHCRLLTAQGASFELRSPDEQAAYVAAYARFLNALTEPVQIDIRSERVSLTTQAEAIEQTSAAHPGGLEAAALEHAAYLRALTDKQTLQRRRIVLVLRCGDRDPELARLTLERRIGETTELLRSAEVTLHPLDGTQAARLLASALDPPGPNHGSEPTGVIHAQPVPLDAQAHQPADTEERGGGPTRPAGARTAHRPHPRRRALAADIRDHRLSA